MKINKICSNRIFYFFLILLLYFSNIHAQRSMLIEQLSNRQVTRLNYDENNILLNKQIFKVSNIKESDNYYEIDVLTKLFDKNEKIKDVYTTTYRCNQDEASIMVMVFPFSDPKSKKTTINTTSINFKDLYDLNNLEDVEMEINFDSGMLNLFGSKSKIKFYDRKLDTLKDKVQIQSNLTVKAYVFGLKIKQLEYSVIEELTDKGLLSFQKFTEADGSYFIVNYKELL